VQGDGIKELQYQTAFGLDKLFSLTPEATMTFFFWLERIENLSTTSSNNKF